MVAGASQNVQFFKQTTWFPGNNRTLSKLGILHYLIGVIKS